MENLNEKKLLLEDIFGRTQGLAFTRKVFMFQFLIYINLQTTKNGKHILTYFYMQHTHINMKVK